MIEPVIQAEHPPAQRRSTEHIRSFSGRRGHSTAAQKLAVQALSDRYCDRFRPQPLALETLFARPAPLILEIGFGMGETTAAIARSLPEHNFLGLEVYPPGIGALLRRIDEQALQNVRIIHHDAFEVVRDMIAPNSLAGIHIFFPDPWPKVRHHKRRLIQPAFVAMLARRLRPDAYLHCATDWQHYAEHMLTVLQGEPWLSNTSSGFAARPAYRPITKFEQRGVKLGHGVWDLLFKRVTTPDPDKV
jgi:tRNA (guanine-N7-)-methyltransferase